MVENQQEKETLENQVKVQLEARLAVLEQQLNEIASNVNARVDEHADVLVIKWSKKLIDSRFTWAFIAAAVGGLGVYSVMTFYICI